MFSAETQRQAAVFDAIGERFDDAFPHRSAQIIATQWIVDRLSPGARVLDIGSGTGLPTAAILTESGLDVVGIDISTQMLRAARRNVPSARFVAMDMLQLDSSLGHFDAAVAFFSLLMVRRRDIPLVLRRVRGILRPGGYFAISMVEGDFDYQTMPYLGQQVAVTAYPRAELEKVLAAEGLDIRDVDVEDFEPAAPEQPPERQIFVCCRVP